MEHPQETKLSFIVPIYGVEKYLRKCVDSLLHQDYDNYEIILVDDGSPDGCSAICDEYAAKYDIIRVIHRKNGGLSAARNSGIEVAHGEYICFVDSDDYWEENVLGEMMAQIERDNLDVLRFDYRNVNEQYVEIHPNRNPKKYADYTHTVTNGEFFLNERLGFACYAWQFILKRNMLSNSKGDGNRCLFTEGIYFEDTDWTPRMLVLAKRVANTDTMVYNYLWRVGSITQAVDMEKKRKVLDDKIKLLSGFTEQRKMVQDDKWFRWQMAAGTISVLSIICKDFYDERTKYIRQVKDYNVFPLSGYRATRSMRIKIALANMSPMLYCMIIKWILR